MQRDCISKMVEKWLHKVQYCHLMSSVSSKYTVAYFSIADSSLQWVEMTHLKYRILFIYLHLESIKNGASFVLRHTLVDLFFATTLV